jgi:hypothetical protein
MNAPTIVGYSPVGIGEKAYVRRSTDVEFKLYRPQSDLLFELYWKFKLGVPLWQQRRMIAAEYALLNRNTIPCGIPGFPKISPFTGTAATIQDGKLHCLDGYCKTCGADTKAEEMFCSDECRMKFYSMECPLCKKRFPFEKMHEHHIKYFPPEMITVCVHCHKTIHTTNKYPHLRPPLSEQKKARKLRKEIY